MSNPGLNRLLRGGGLTEFHVVAAGRRQSGPPTFNGERFEFSAAKTEYKKEHDFSKKDNREEKGEKKRKKEGKEGDDSSSDDEDGPHFKSSGIHKKGSDADGDGKTGEGKNKKKDFKKDDNKNGKPDFMEKK